MNDVLKRKQTPEELSEKINEYFLVCDASNEGKKDIIKPYTLSGLLCHISLTRPEFERMIAERRYRRVLGEACARIEAYIEENMLTGALSCNASLNSLKYSFDWGDKHVYEADNDSRSITVTLSPETAQFAR